ncbi:hypothetical protein ACFLXY_09145 [Chloroflexota bacterium]
MSDLGSISGQAEHDQRLLSELNDALTTLEIDALERLEEFALTNNDVDKSRNILFKFSTRLREEIQLKIASDDLRSLVGKLRSGMKPIDDWVQDLICLENILQSNQKNPSEALPILEDILSLIDEDFAEDLRMLYSN